MDKETRDRLEAAGFRVCDAEEFLGLTKEITPEQRAKGLIDLWNDRESMHDAQDDIAAAIRAAVAEEREVCAQIADYCARERASTAARQPAYVTPPRDMMSYVIMAKESEAKRIADIIRKRK